MTDPITRNDSGDWIRNGPGLMANTRWDRFNESPDDIRQEIAEGEAMVRHYAAEVGADSAEIDRLITQFTNSLAASGLSRDQVERYRAHLEAARDGIRSGHDALEQASDSLEELQESALAGLNPVDAAAMQALAGINPDRIVTPELQGEVDALQANNDPLHGAWLEHRQQVEQAAAGVLQARNRIIEAQAELRFLQGSDEAVEGLQNQLDEIDAWITEYNVDVGLLRDWQGAVQHDRTHLAEETGALSAEAAAEVREIAAQLRAALDSAAEAAAAHSAAEAAAEQEFDAPPARREPF